MKHRILVIDDEENMLVLLKRVLGKQGYRVDCARSAESGLERVHRGSCSLAIVDVSLPGMDGIGFVSRLRKMRRDVPVILVTAFPSWEKEQVAKDLGCSGYLSKPLDMKRLKFLIGEILQKTGSGRK
jgi:two-component system alkaline phosphatase synthesis response regulator PhoP